MLQTSVKQTPNLASFSKRFYKIMNYIVLENSGYYEFQLHDNQMKTMIKQRDSSPFGDDWLLLLCQHHLKASSAS